MHIVAIAKSEDYNPESIRSAIELLLAPLGGLSSFIKPGETVLLKPNMLAGKPPERAVTTHPEIVRQVILMVKEVGGIPLVGDSPGIEGLKRVADKSGIQSVIDETGAELVQFTVNKEVTGTGIFKRFALARPYLEADRVINLPKLKTHEMMSITCAVKNLFGAVVGTAKAAWHLKAGADRDLFARMLVEIHQMRPPDLTIVDAVTAMEGDGPNSGDPRYIGCLMAGKNAVAIDVIAADIISLPEKLRYTQRAAERLGIPGTDRKDINVVGVDPNEVKVLDFRLPHISDVQFGLPAFLKDRFRNHLTTRPYANMEKCKLCGVCKTACPPQAISISHDKLIIDYKNCIRCFCCRELCPEAAFEVHEGFLLKLFKKR